MASIKYVIELSDQDKGELIDIVTKGKSPARTILRASYLYPRRHRYAKNSPVWKMAETPKNQGFAAICRDT